MESQIEETTKKFYKQWWFWVLAIIVFFMIVGAMGNQGSENGQNGGSTPASSSQSDICDNSLQTLKKEAQKVDYKQLTKDPSSFVGTIATFTGKILQIQQNGDAGVIRLSVTNEGYGIWSPDDVLYVTYNKATQAVEGNIVTVTGALTGSETYTSEANYQITIPSINICSVETQSAVATSSSTSINQQPPTTPAQPKIIPGLTSINASGIWKNWNSDAADDGIEFSVAYLDSIGNPIYEHDNNNINIDVSPLSIDVKIYTQIGDDYPPQKGRLVYSGSFTNDQIIRGLPWPKVRVPKEQISVNPQVDNQFGVAVVTLHTPAQGNFSAEDDTLELYENNP